MSEQLRRLSLADRRIRELARGLRTVAAANVAARPFPGENEPEKLADADEKRHAAALMRVNHAGEIAAQALYHGQALTARNASVRQGLLEAARDETDHLAWCEQRVRELDSRTSLLAPVWYAGSIAIGALAGLAGERYSLGFVAVTEIQVSDHLQSHLEALQEQDERSRRVNEQMKADEERHGQAALESGGRYLPRPVRKLMQHTARVMTKSAYRL